MSRKGLTEEMIIWAKYEKDEKAENAAVWGNNAPGRGKMFWCGNESGGEYQGDWVNQSKRGRVVGDDVTETRMKDHKGC